MKPFNASKVTLTIAVFAVLCGMTGTITRFIISHTNDQRNENQDIFAQENGTRQKSLAALNFFSDQRAYPNGEKKDGYYAACLEIQKLENAGTGHSKRSLEGVLTLT